MIYYNINEEGIVTTISNRGVLLQFAIDSEFMAELYFSNTQQAVQQLGIDNIHSLTIHDFMAYYLAA